MIMDFINITDDASLYIREQPKAAVIAIAKKKFNMPVTVIIKRQFILYNLPAFQKENSILTVKYFIIIH